MSCIYMILFKKKQGWLRGRMQYFLVQIFSSDVFCLDIWWDQGGLKEDFIFMNCILNGCTVGCLEFMVFFCFIIIFRIDNLFYLFILYKIYLESYLYLIRDFGVFYGVVKNRSGEDGVQNRLEVLIVVYLGMVGKVKVFS